MSFRRTTPLSSNLASVVAEMGIRRAIRHYLRPDCTNFVLAIRIHDANAVGPYRSAAEKLLKNQVVIGGEGDYVSVVDMTATNSVSARSLEIIARAILLYTDDADLSHDLDLVIDNRLCVEPPSAEHFEAAAEQLRMVLQKSDADFLASQSLLDIGTVSRPGRPIHRIVQQLRSMPRSPDIPDEPAPSLGVPRQKRLEELAGYGAAKDWGLRLVSELGAWRRGDLDWADVDKGALINGPPGCGKTSYAAALANSCGVTLIIASYARWQAQGHQGDMMKAMRKSFAEAHAARPCILFIDEMDSFGDRDANSRHDYTRQVVNSLLECLDPLGGREGVVVVGATNSARMVDPALLRPGRLERVIDIPPLDGSSRAAILRYHLGDQDFADLGNFVEASDGWYGARIEMVAREARRAARAEGRPLMPEDIASALPPRTDFTEAERFRLAVHEVGHAIVGHVLRPEQLIKVAIDRAASPGSGKTSLGRTEFREPAAFATSDAIADTIAILMAGVAAENAVFGEHSTGAGGERGDLSQATDIATMMERSFGFGDDWVTDCGSGDRPLESLRHHDAELKRAVARRLDLGFERAMAILIEHRLALQDLATLLSGRLELDAALVKAVCDEKAASSCRH
ncbi:AAA family ATPase [Rhizobium leguminosarum]|uniref:AAA family ATPase n=1 Tax=Rhizobium leguminosarum TaxID=384 RepID=UPI003F965E26